MIPPPIQIHGPKSWALAATFSGLCTLSIFMTGLAEAVGLRPLEGTPFPRKFMEMIDVGMYLMFLGALYIGFLGMASMIVCGVRNVGRVEVRGRPLPPWAMPLFCGAAYAAPWALLLLIRVSARTD